MQTVNLNGKQLSVIGKKSHSAEVTLLSLALRERARDYSDIRRTKARLVKEGEKIIANDYMQFWKDLQDAGVGSIVYGRKNNPDRFEWHFSLKQVAKAALDGTDEKLEPIKTIPVAKSKPKVIRRPAKHTAPVSIPKQVMQEKLVYVSLRRGFDLAIKLPGDVSKEEIETITKALQRVSS